MKIQCQSLKVRVFIGQGKRKKRHNLRKLNSSVLYFFVQTAGSVQSKMVILKTLHQLHPFLLLHLPEEVTVFDGEYGLGVTVTLLGVTSVQKL